MVAPMLSAIAAAYDEKQALQYSYVATASMCSYPSLPDDSSLEAWDCGGPCDAVPGMTNVFTVNNTAKDAFVYGGKLNGECTLTFRGTSNTAGWMQDLKSATLVDLKGCSANGKTCKVGSGFLDNYNSLSAAMKSKFTSIGCTKDTPIAFVGHSLGAAEATVAMFSMHLEGYQISKSYTFGQPRVGDPTFKQAFESAFKNTPTFHITHAEDPVPQVPFASSGFEHVSQEIYYASGTDKGFRTCDGSGEDSKCAASHAKDFVSAGLKCALSPQKCPHLNYMTPMKKTLMNDASCTAPKSITV
jgi:hypothetical protein